MVRPKPKRNQPTPPLECEFYKNENGTEPVKDWLKSIDEAVCIQVGSDISDVQWRWPHVRKPLVDSFGDGLFEVRTSFDGNIYRVLFCIHKSKMLLLHGFMKKTPKTPKDVIELARKRKREVEAGR